MQFPERPDYQCLAYRQASPVWEYLGDLYRGSDAWIERTLWGISPKLNARIYLPPEPAELQVDYLSRLGRSPYDNRFAKSIHKFAALVLANGVEVQGPLDPRHAQDIDREGTTLEVFLHRCMISALRDGHTFVLVDFSLLSETPYSLADVQRLAPRPYWVHYGVNQLVNWRVESGKLTLAVLRETVFVPLGLYGEQEVEQYRVLYPGGWDLWRQVGDSFEWVSGGATALQSIPLACLSGGQLQQWGVSLPPLRALADLNLTHYQVKSDHLRKIHLCCLPVPELKDSLRPEGEPLVIGPNSFVHIRDPQGGFSWKEPTALSIEQSRKEVADLEEAMDLFSSAYLQAPGDRQAAYTTAVQAVELESSLGLFALQFAEGVNQALRFHADWLNQPAAIVKLSGDIVRDKGRDSQMLLAYSALADRGQLSQASFLALLQGQEFLPADLDLSLEPETLQRDGVLLRELMNLPQLDLVDKAGFLELLKAHRFLPSDFDVADMIARTGVEIRVTAAGYLKTQPTPDDEFIPPAQVLQVDLERERLELEREQLDNEAV